MNQRAAFRETLQLAIASAMPEGVESDPLSLAHLRDMWRRIETYPPGDFTEAKLGRWLVSPQCALVAADVGVTLDDVKAINMRWAEQ